MMMTESLLDLENDENSYKKMALCNMIDSIRLSITTKEVFNCIHKYCLIFRDMFDYLVDRDTNLEEVVDQLDLNTHLEQVQRKLLQAMLEICHDEITREIKESENLAIIIEDVSSFCETPYFAILFRYLKKGESVERFWSFVNHQYHALAEYVLSLMKCFEVDKNPRKLVAQAYDGSSQLAGIVRARVMAVYPDAFYVPCHAFDLCLVMKRVLSDNRDIRIFFANLNGICDYFSKSPSIRKQMIEMYPSIRFPPKDASLSESVRILCDSRQEIVSCINQSSQLEEKLTQSGHIASLDNYYFIFWLSFFRKIFPRVDVLSTEIKRAEWSFNEVSSSARRFVEDILNISNEYRSEIKNTPSTANAKRKYERDEHMKRQAVEACAQIVAETKLRFENAIHSIGRQLFNPAKYKSYQVQFPERILNAVCYYYPYLNKLELRKRLETVYKYLEQNVTLCDIDLTEITKLLSILQTVPTESPEINWLAVDRMRKFPMKAPNRHYELNSLAMVMIERDFIKSIVQFNNKVIDKVVENQKWNNKIFPKEINEDQE